METPSHYSLRVSVDYSLLCSYHPYIPFPSSSPYSSFALYREDSWIYS